MINIKNLSKVYYQKGIRTVVADDISITLPSNTSIALLGRNGAGKSSLLRMIAGTMDPDAGTITHHGTVSWPVGFSGSFHKDLTGAQNTRFVARIYGVDTDDLVAFVEDFSELGKHFNLPLRTYSSGMKSRLAFGVSMGLPFDTYLVDEVTSVGDAAFKKKCNIVFAQRMEKSGAVVVSHSMNTLRTMCKSAMLLENGKLEYFDTVEVAIKRYNELLS